MPDMTAVELSRLQFALTAMYHFLSCPCIYYKHSKA